MPKERVRIRYDGPALSEHSIDVNHLAPALLSLGDLCTLANRKFNKDKADIKVLVLTNTEEKCFEFVIEIAQTILEKTKPLLQEDTLKTAEEIGKWLGLISGSFLGLFKFVKWVNGRKIESKKTVKKAGKDIVEITVEGDNNSVTVYSQTLELYHDADAIRGVQQIVQPLAEEGYDSLEFENKNEAHEKITKEDAIDILEIDVDSIEEIENEEKPQTITAWVQVYSPVYDPKATKWRFEYGEKPEYMDISSTDIEKKALQRGGALVNDTYKVKLEITQVLTKTKKFKNRYKIKEVLEFHPAKLKSQGNLFNNEP